MGEGKARDISDIPGPSGSNADVPSLAQTNNYVSFLFFFVILMPLIRPNQNSFETELNLDSF